MQQRMDTEYLGYQPNPKDWIPKGSKKKSLIYTGVIVLQAVVDVLWLSLLRDDEEEKQYDND